MRKKNKPHREVMNKMMIWLMNDQKLNLNNLDYTNYE